MTKKCSTSLDFFPATLMALEIFHISVSKFFLFWLRLILTICHSLLFQSNFHITATLELFFSSLDPLHQSSKLDLLIIIF